MKDSRDDEVVRHAEFLYKFEPNLRLKIIFKLTVDYADCADIIRACIRNNTQTDSLSNFVKAPESVLGRFAHQEPSAFPESSVDLPDDVFLPFDARQILYKSLGNNIFQAVILQILYV